MNSREFITLPYQNRELHVGAGDTVLKNSDLIWLVPTHKKSQQTGLLMYMLI